MNMNDDRQVDQQMRAALPDDVPAEVGERLRRQLAEFRVRTSTEYDAARRRALVRYAGWGISLAAAAAVAIAATVGLLWRPQTSLAEVATAVARQPWVHARTVNSTRGESETWYSVPRQITSFRGNDRLEYRDYRLGVFYRYDRQEKTLYRLPEVTRRPQYGYDSMAAAMTVLLQDERTVENPLETLDFLGRDRESMKLVDQNVEQVNENGHAWLDYRMTVTHVELTEPMTLLFRVDADTKLPTLCRIEGLVNGRRVNDETLFDYPEKGPADVYALGAPKDAVLVDRVPKDDLKRILETLQAGRERMDPYRAIFVNRTEPADYAWWRDAPNILYRKGDKFRADYSGGSVGDVTTDPPAPEEDPGAWWRENVKFFRWYPHYVTRGSTQYTSQLSRNADGSNGDQIVAVKQYEFNVRPGETFPALYSARPEFACRPPMGIGNQHQEPILDMNPAEGPAGCILLTVRHTSDEGRINEKGVGLADENRFWLDPARDYIAMRWDMMTADEQGNPKIHESDVVEEVARSPGGVWYATKIRRKNSVGTEDGKGLDQVYYLYVDFDADLPDSLFDPPQPGKIE